jgi:glucose uptake protein GlcU
MKKRIIAVIIAFFVSVLMSLIVVWIFNRYEFEKVFTLGFIALLIGAFITYKDKDENKKDISAQKDVDEK